MKELFILKNIKLSLSLYFIFIYSSTNAQINYLFSNYTVSKYIPKSGTQIGKGCANQSLILFDYQNYNLYLWLNHGFPDKRITETDFGFMHNCVYSNNILKGKLSNNLGAHIWIFPIYNFNCGLFEDKITYQGPININLLITQLLKSREVEFGTRIYLDISIPIRLNTKISIVPIYSSAYHYHFFEMDKTAYNAIGLVFKISFKNYVISSFINKQFSTENINYLKKEFIYNGFGVEYYR